MNTICQLSKHISVFLCIFFFPFFIPEAGAATPDVNAPYFDLRDYHQDSTTNYTTGVRDQNWGTCWTFGTTGAMESNLLMTGAWQRFGLPGEPDLAEYHLDKYNGFNRKGMSGDEPNDYSHYSGQNPPFPGSNLDEPLWDRVHGIIVHLGGDYQISTAYLTNHGAVNETDDTRIDSGSIPEMRIKFGYSDTDGIPRQADYTYIIPRHVQWLSLVGDDGRIRQKIKESLILDGAVATCMYWGSNYYDYGSGIHYQPPSDDREPNHAIVIVGWDDNLMTQAGQPGAWLCRNSWGQYWGTEGDGHFWISYHDKHAGKHPLMGAVSFTDMEKITHDSIYSHGLHGWRYDTSGVSDEIFEAANCYTSLQDERLSAVGIYTLEDNLSHELKIYEGSSPSGNMVHRMSGTLSRAGFHLIDLDAPLDFHQGENFCIGLVLSGGGYAFDASFEVVTAMGLRKKGNRIDPFTPDFYEPYYKFDFIRNSKSMGTITEPPYDVYSSAGEGQSYYRDYLNNWRDFYSFDAFGKCGTRWDDNSWNFAINGYTQRIIYIESQNICGYNAPCFSSFEEGIGSAGADDIIKVAPGIYYSPLILDISAQIEIGGDSIEYGDAGGAVVITGPSI